jgi:hypothetical protein
MINKILAEQYEVTFDYRKPGEVYWVKSAKVLVDVFIVEGEREKCSHQKAQEEVELLYSDTDCIVRSVTYI